MLERLEAAVAQQPVAFRGGLEVTAIREKFGVLTVKCDAHENWPPADGIDDGLRDLPDHDDRPEVVALFTA